MLDSKAARWKTLPNASDNLKWWQDSGRLHLALYISIIYVGEALVGFDSTIVGKLQALSIWKSDLGNPDATRIGLLNAVGFITSVVFGPVHGWINDRWGRCWSMRIYGHTMILGTIVGVCAGVNGANAYGLFLASRAITGVGLAGATQTAMIMCQEISHPRSRALVAGAFDQNWALGNVIASLVVLGTSYVNSSWAWRIPYLFQLPPAIYLLVALHFIPESPRYLLSKGRDGEALDFLVKYHGNGNPDDELVKFEYEEMKGSIEMEKEATGTKWKDVITVPSNRHRFGLALLMAFAYRLSGSAIIQFYYSVILTQVGLTGSTRQSGIGAGLSVFSWFCQIAGAFGVAKTKRRGMLLYTWPILLVLMGCLAATSGMYANSDRTNTAAAYGTVVMIWLYSGLTSYQAPLLYSYPAEIMSYVVRAKGLVVWTVFSQGWGVYNSFVNSVALSDIGWKFYCVQLPIIAVTWLLMMRYMVETQEMTLEGIAVAFEGKDAKVPIVGEEAGSMELDDDLKDGKSTAVKTSTVPALD